jgi:hypothetical protein
VLIVDIFPFEDFVDLMQCVFHRDFVRKVRRKHAALRTDPVDDVGQRAFVSLTADEKSVAAEVIDDGFSQRSSPYSRSRSSLSMTMGIPNRYGSDWQ